MPDIPRNLKDFKDLAKFVHWTTQTPGIMRMVQALFPKTPTNSSHAPASSTATPSLPAEARPLTGQRADERSTRNRPTPPKTPSPKDHQAFWVELMSKNRFRIWGLSGETMDDRGKRAHGVCVPEGESLAPVALLCTSCKHGACQEVSKPPRTMPPPWPSLGRRAGAMAWG